MKATSLVAFPSGGRWRRRRRMRCIREQRRSGAPTRRAGVYSRRTVKTSAFVFGGSKPPPYKSSAIRDQQKELRTNRLSSSTASGPPSPLEKACRDRRPRRSAIRDQRRKNAPTRRGWRPRQPAICDQQWKSAPPYKISRNPRATMEKRTNRRDRRPRRSAIRDQRRNSAPTRRRRMRCNSASPLRISM